MNGRLPVNIAGRFAALLEQDPQAVAFSFHRPDSGDNDAYTRQAFWQAGSAFAETMLPLAAGSHVMLIMPLGKRLLAAHFGAQLNGCVASIFTHPSAKLSHEVYRRNLANALTLMHPDVIITVADYVSDVSAALGGSRCRVIDADAVPECGATRIGAWQTRGENEAAVIQYSSGSTGLQKGVALTQRMILDQIDTYASFIELDPRRDRVCSWLPLYHDMGLFTAFLMPLVTGSAAFMIDPFRWVQNPVSILQQIARVRGTLCWQPNFAFSLLATRCGSLPRGSLDLSCMRGFINCSEPAYPQSMEKFVDALAQQGVRADQMWVCYAMAENAFAVSGSGQPGTGYRALRIDPARYSHGEVVPDTGPEAMQLASCGVPLSHCEVKVVSPDSHEPLSGEGVGEIAIRSPFLFAEYLNNHDATAACRDQQGWYYTGDLGFVHDGHLYLSGRKKDLIIVAGRNFYPQDIEKIAADCANVISGRVVALGERDAAAGTERVIILLESHHNEPEAKQAIAVAVRQKVFEALDCAVFEVSVMPHMWLQKTSSGKIARGENLARYRDWRKAQSPAAQRGPTGDNTPTQRQQAPLVNAAWGTVLAAAAYAYAVLYVLDNNVSWNVYAGF